MFQLLELGPNPTAFGLCPLPSALCPLPSALCPLRSIPFYRREAERREAEEPRSGPRLRRLSLGGRVEPVFLPFTLAHVPAIAMVLYHRASNESVLLTILKSCGAHFCPPA
jgi:hypothetical protein